MGQKHAAIFDSLGVKLWFFAFYLCLSALSALQILRHFAEINGTAIILGKSLTKVWGEKVGLEIYGRQVEGQAVDTPISDSSSGVSA